MDATLVKLPSESNKDSPRAEMRTDDNFDVKDMFKNHDPEDINANNDQANNKHANHIDLESLHASHQLLNQQLLTDASTAAAADQEEPCINAYQHKKNLAQGMMDLALLSANVGQLRYVLESSSTHPYYFVSLAFISLSIVLQMAVGVGLILNGRLSVYKAAELRSAVKINNKTVLGVYLVTLVNVFISSFSVASTPLLPPTMKPHLI